MKLRKQAPAKAAILVLTAVLFASFYGLIQAQPRIKAEEEPAGRPVDYNRFFAPGPAPANSDAAPPVNPRIRTRAS